MAVEVPAMIHHWQRGPSWTMDMARPNKPRGRLLSPPTTPSCPALLDWLQLPCTHHSQLSSIAGLAPTAMHPQSSMGLPYVLLPIPFPNQFPHQFMPPAPGTGDEPNNEMEAVEEKSEGKSSPSSQHAEEEEKQQDHED